MTIVTAMLAVAMVAVVALVAQLAVVVIARHRAASAADFAALGAAAWVIRGSSAACGRAEELARAGGARLDSCEVIGMDVRVTVSLPAGVLGARATGRARAGPAE